MHAGKIAIHEMQGNIIVCMALAALLTAPILLCGCNRKKAAEVPVSDTGSIMGIKSADILSLRKGMTPAEVERLLGTSGKHQFSARLSAGDYLCVSYSFERPYFYYYFLFRANVLEKITIPLPPEVELVPYMDVQREINKPLNAEKRIEQVLNANELSGSQFIASLKSAQPKQSDGFNVLPAFIVASQKSTRADKVMEADYAKNTLLAQKFNPAKILLGDPENKLILEYGPPLTVHSNALNEIRVYQFGSSEPLRVNPAYHFSKISFTVKSGIVIRIFSHDFVENM